MSVGYLLGTHHDELRRLGTQHRVWAEVTAAGWRRAGFGVGQTLLDLGCGPGLTSIDLAHRVGPRGRIIAVDESSCHLDVLTERARQEHVANIHTVCCDVAAYTPEVGSLDGAYARWIFSSLHDVEGVLSRVAAGLRPGSVLAVLDYFNYRSMTFAPRSATMELVTRALEASWREAGGDLNIQGRLPQLARHCGLELASVEVHAAVARPGEPLWAWPKSFFRSHVPRLVRQGHLTKADADAFFFEWRQHEDREDGFLQLPPLYEVIVRRPPRGRHSA
ncbi:MAG: methyltransferase domain-containing protein [Myxococcales bacterium FL481]|nr:MAG: methyltransferase domain-containing protein [Myxococcales bacterium FL481]